MVILCRELLASTLSAGFPSAAFTSLDEAVLTEFLCGHVESVDQLIECLRARDAAKTRICPPDSHGVFFVCTGQHTLHSLHGNSFK
jgi:hypothetical protein